MSDTRTHATILEARGENTDIAVRQLMVVLKWNGAADLDLLAFYAAKDGRTGGVFSNRYPGGCQGDVNRFPFIELTDDAGDIPPEALEKAASEKQEILQISELGDMAEIHIVAMNYSDAVANRPSRFQDYDAAVIVMNERWETVEVPLNSPEVGHVAVICKIANHGPEEAPRLVNSNRILDMKDFMTTIPGANMFIRLKPDHPR